MPGQASNSVQTQIVAAILNALQPLIAEGKMRKIVRVQTDALEEATLPALHVIVGDEIPDGEDSRGYISSFDVVFRSIIEDARNPYVIADDATAFVQKVMEADPQLGALVRRVTYRGNVPYTIEVTKPRGGNLTTYSVQYGRERGNPTQNY